MGINEELIFDSPVPANEESIKLFGTVTLTSQPRGPLTKRLVFKLFRERIQICTLDPAKKTFSSSDDWAICSVGQHDGGLWIEILDIIHSYIRGELKFHGLLERVEESFSREGMGTTVLSIEEESNLIKQGLISGEPKYEQRDDLDDLSLFGGDLDKEVPLTYTRSEVIEIIKMIRPDIADVQTVIDKLLYKP